MFSLTTSSGSLLDQSYDAHGSVTKRSTPATGSQALGVDYQGLLRVRGSDVYLYDSNSQRTHVFHSTPSGGELTATIGGLLEARYTFDGTNFVPTEVLALAGLGDAPVARVRASDGRVSLLHRDAQGSVVLVRRGTSPGVTSERVRFAYEPFGRVLHETGPDRDRELLRYHGGMIDPAGSEFVQFGFRRYDPVSRRWASADPAFADDPYGFNLGNPLAFRDPFGLQSAPSGGTHPCDPDGCGYPRQPPDPREPPEPNGPSRGSASVSTGRVDADSDSESGAFLVGGRDFRPGVELTYAGSLQSHGQTHWIQFGALEWEVQTTHGSFYARVQEPADGGTTTASSPLNRVWFVDNLGNPDSPWYPSGAIIRSAEGMSMFDSPQLGTPMQQAVLNLATRAGWIRNRQDVIALHRRQVFDAYLVHRGQVLARASWYRTWTLFDPFSLSMTYGLVVTGITDVSPASGILEQQRRATLRLRGDARILGSALPVARGP